MPATKVFLPAHQRGKSNPHEKIKDMVRSNAKMVFPISCKRLNSEKDNVTVGWRSQERLPGGKGGKLKDCLKTEMHANNHRAACCAQ